MSAFLRQRLIGSAVRLAMAVLAGGTVVPWQSTGAGETAAPYVTESLRGRVVFLAEEFANQTGIPSVPEARERVLALRTAAGTLIPLLEDVRGRAFRRDERLRQREVELVVRRYEQSPLVQIIRVLEVAPDGRYDLDYWCEICAIAMFEQKDCDCCQGPVELRRRKVETSGSR
jgi:hypothetical protein